jgi:hypothetical protein
MQQLLAARNCLFARLRRWWRRHQQQRKRRLSRHGWRLPMVSLSQTPVGMTDVLASSRRIVIKYYIRS